MAAKDTTAKIAALGRLCGISYGYRDNFGHRHRTSQATYRALLSAMGVPWEDPESLEEELARRLLPCQYLLPPVSLTREASRPGWVQLYAWTPSPELRQKTACRCLLRDEAGQELSWEAELPAPDQGPSFPVEGGYRLRLELPLPAPLPLGYYELQVAAASGSREETGQTLLVVAPKRAYLPEQLASGQRLWGLNVPLYALKSRRNWGMGDFTDLAALTDWASSLGAAFVGINPLHAPSPLIKGVPSPYSPTSRRFLSFLYLDLEAVPEMAACPEAQALVNSPEFRRQVARLRQAPLVSYAGIRSLKRRVLELLCRAFLDRHGPPEAPRTSRGEDFARYLTARGPSLASFGAYEALADYLGKSDWRRWPRNLQDPGSPAVAEFCRQHPGDVHLHQYMQWLTATQLRQVCSRARSQGLPFTLYLDLALAAASGGYDTWGQRELFALGAEIGAPGDAFNPKGQLWGIPPLIPWRLRETGHRFFVEVLRANSPPGGMLRLDHVMGLFRLFWIPRGAPASQGAYVYYPARELLAVLALESARRRTLVIGEDLGTVPAVVRRELERLRVFSYRVFYFERDFQCQFRAPEDYPRQAMAAVTTHDLPTLTGYWQGRDLALKRDLNLYPDPRMAAADEAGREEDRHRLVAALDRRHLLPPGSCADPGAASCQEDLKTAVVEYLAQSRAALLELRLEEIFNFPEQQNLPGTVKTHANWNLKLPLSLEEMQADPEAARLAALLNRHRGREDKEEK
jgi:4-alpha-glucanotransferase